MKVGGKVNTKFKMISLALVISIILQVLMPVVLPLISVAAGDTNGILETSLGKVIMQKGEIVEVDNIKILPIDIYMESEKNIFGITAYIDYDTNVFEALEEGDIKNIHSPWTLEDYYYQEAEDGVGAGYNISMSPAVSEEGHSNFKICTVELKLKKEVSSTEIFLNNVIVTGIEAGSTTEGESGTTETGFYNIDYTVTFENTPQPLSYSIIYNDPSGEATGMPTSNGTKTPGEDYQIASAPTRAGYEFKGWNTREDGNGGSYAAGATYSTDANLTLYAQWEQIKGTLIVNPNGGVWEESSNEQTFKEIPGAIRTMTPPDADKTPKGARIRFYGNGGEPDEVNKIQDTTFEKWELSGSGSLENGIYTYGDDVGTLTAKYTRNSITLPTARKAGAEIEGWYTKQIGGDKIGEPGDEITPTDDMTLFAHWNELDYTLTIDPNGGKYKGRAGTTTITGKYKDIITIENPEPPKGHTITLNNEGEISTIEQKLTFSEWSTPQNGSLLFGFTEDEPEIVETTYIFANLHEGNDIITASYTEEDVTLEAPEERTGYTFLGWYDQEGIKANTTFKPTTDLELYARWQGNKYTVRFNPGTGATVERDSQEVTYGSAYGELPTPVKEGSTFSGWYYGATLVTAEKIVDLPQDVTLEAKWDQVKYILTVSPNGGKFNGAKTDTQVKGILGEEVTILNPEAPNGYTVILNNDGETSTLNEKMKFTGWTAPTSGRLEETTYTFAAANDSITANYEQNSIQLPTNLTKSGYEFDGWYDQQTGGNKVDNTYTPTANNVTLYARWKNGKYTITFDAGENGTITREEEKTKEVTYNGKYGIMPVPESKREGYHFNGWYDQNGREIKETDTVEITEDITLTARWLGSEYTVTFDFGDGRQTTKKVRNEGTYGNLPEVTAEEGFIFDGWYDEENNKIESTTIVELTEDITLYAKFLPKQFTIVFKNDDGSTIDAKTVDYGTTLEYEGNVPTKSNVPSGYKATFTGWDNEEKLQNIKENAILVATYSVTPIEYTITYRNTKDSDNSQNPTTYTIEDGTIQLKNLAKQGKYEFKGWYTAEDNTGVKVTSIDTSMLKNVILYAKWEEDKLFLSSEKYKIGENDIDNYEVNDLYLDKIQTGTTVTEFINNCDTNGNITVWNKNVQLQAGDIIGTGMTIKVIKDNEQITLTAVVMGDTSGNGIITPEDISDIKNMMLKTHQLEGAKLKAADIDDSKKVFPADLSDAIKSHIKNIRLIYLKK